VIYWFAPPADSKSGLAVYARDLLPFLKEHGEVEWVRAGAVVPPGARRVYNLGNHRDNAAVLARALAEPDIVLLHDANLHHAALGLDDPSEAFGDDRALRLRRRGVWLEPYEALEGALVPVLRRQKLILVHSEYAREVLRMRGIGVPAAVIPMGVVVPRATAEKEGCSIGLFGHIGTNRKVGEILDGVRSLRARYPDLILKAVGASVPEALDGEPGVVVRRGLPDEGFFKEMAATTLFLNLRYPVMGETSLSTLQALALGTVAVVSELGSYAELPDAAVVKVPPDAPWTGPVAGLLADPARRQAMEAAARAWVEQRHAPRAWAAALREALCNS